MNNWALALVKEFGRHPSFGMLLAAGLCGLAWYSLEAFAKVDDLAAVVVRVDAVEIRVDSIRETIERNALEQYIHSLEAEIFGLERLVSDGSARDLDYQRLSNLRSDLGTAKRDLDRIN